MLQHVLIWFAVLYISLWIEETVQKWKNVQNHVKIKELPFDMDEIWMRCCSPFNAETCFNLICIAISLWIEETEQNLKNVQHHVKIEELPSDTDELRTWCCSQFNAETSSNLVCSAISLWIEETVQKWKNVQNHVKVKELPFEMNEIMIKCCSPINAETSSKLSFIATWLWIEETVKSWKMFKIV